MTCEKEPRRGQWGWVLEGVPRGLSGSRDRVVWTGTVALGSATRPLRALGKFYLDASGTEHDISACHQVFIAAGTSSVGRCLCRGFLGVVAPPPRARCPRRVLLTPERLRRWRAAWRKPLAGGALPTGSPVPAQVTKACEPCPGICDGPQPRLSLLFPLSPPPPPNIAYGKLSKYCASGSFMCCLRSLHFPDWPGTAEQVLSRSPAGSVRRGACCLPGAGRRPRGVPAAAAHSPTAEAAACCPREREGA